MPTFYCPPLLFKKDTAPLSPQSFEDSPAPLFEAWFIQRISLGEKPAWLFVHGETFYSFTMESLPGEDVREALKHFREALGRILFYQEFSPEEITCVLQRLEGDFKVEGRISKGMCRSLEVLREHYRWFSERAQGLEGGETETVSLLVNETPLEMIGHDLPCDAFRRLTLSALRERRKAA